MLDSRSSQPISPASMNLPRGNPVATANPSFFSGTLDPSLLLQAPGPTGPSLSGSGWSDDTLPVAGDNEKSMEWGPEAYGSNQGRTQRDVNYSSF